MNIRLQQFLAAENLTQAQFAESINVAPAGISHILAGRNKPGYDFLLNTMKKYPSLDIEWLMTGKGKMYKNVQPAEQQPAARTVAETPPSVASATAALQQNQEELPFKDEESIDLFSNNAELAGYSAPSPVNDENTRATSGINTAADNTQRPVKQRKAVKIIVFFDDNTFQEF